MKKVLIGVAVVLGLALVGLVGAVAMQPDVMHVERSTIVAAEAVDVAPLAGDLHEFVKWDPWSDLDPNSTTEFSDPSTGVGAWYSWKGNDQVGEGKMTITAVEEGKVVERLEFLAPWVSVAEVAMLYAPEGSGTKVTWTFDQQADFGTKAMGLFVDMDEMLGADFAKGLASLKGLAETNAAARIEAAKKAEAEAAEAAAAAAVAEEEAAGG